jgi:hypothetical protein
MNKRRLVVIPPILNRFTSLPIALDVLSQKRITLLSPKTWEDQNDAYYLERYRGEMKFRSVLAICFSLRKETFHHWRVFSNGACGVCIEFNKAKLLKSVADQNGFRSAEVTYHLIRYLQRNPPELEIWPFLKRKPFEDEKEFRIIYESKTESLQVKHVSIDIASIRKVTLSPWLPKDMSESVKELIKGIDGCDTLNVNRSSLIDNTAWREVIDQNSN